MPVQIDCGRDPALLLNATPWRELVPAFRKLVAFLGQNDFSMIRALPERGGLQDLPMEPANLARVFRGRQGLFHRSAVPWLYTSLLRARRPRAELLYRFFHRGRQIARSQLDRSMPGELVSELMDAGILESVDRRIRCRVMLVPFQGRIYVTDPPALKTHNEYVYNGRTTFFCLEAILDRLTTPPAEGGVTRLLDVGCGNGTLALALAPRFGQAWGVDIVGRCIDYARLNAELQGVSNCTFLNSDLYAEVSGSFDVIVANPPCAWAERAGQKRVFEDGGADYGNELPGRIMAGALERLKPDGVAYCTMIAPTIQGRPLLAEVLPRLLGGLAASIVVYSLIEEFKYKNAPMYRRHGISKFVRYFAVVRPANQFSIRFESPPTLQLLGSKFRVSTARLIAALMNRSTG